MVMWWIAGAVAVIAIIAAAIIYKRRKKKEKEMPQGIQIFNSSGNLIFDLANNTTYILGTGNTNAQAGSISDARITARTWVIILSCQADCSIPYFSVTQGRLSWQYLSATESPSPKNVTFMYGVY